MISLSFPSVHSCIGGLMVLIMPIIIPIQYHYNNYALSRSITATSTLVDVFATVVWIVGTYPLWQWRSSWATYLACWWILNLQTLLIGLSCTCIYKLYNSGEKFNMWLVQINLSMYTKHKLASSCIHSQNCLDIVIVPMAFVQLFSLIQQAD